jgi:hypothetical protein
MSEVDERSHFSFRISLRVCHPHVAPEEITEALGSEPKRFWKAGEPRSTPKGTPLAGFNRETYWVADIAKDRWPTTLNAAIQDSLAKLVIHRSFLHGIRADGGRIELFIGWFFENQSGDVLSHECLAMAGDLKIDLSFDIYSPDQPQNW